MLDRYIKINERVIVSKQTSNGVWYCAELPAETVKEMDALIGEINKVYNKYNKKERVSPTPSSKEKTPPVKGLK